MNSKRFSTRMFVNCVKGAAVSSDRYCDSAVFIQMGMILQKFIQLYETRI
jgi:hypothetical protein